MPYLEDYIPAFKYHGFSIGDSAGTTATTASVTLNKTAGMITTASITGTGSAYYLTLTNNKITTGDMVVGFLQRGSMSAGTPILSTVTAAGGSAVFTLINLTPAPAWSGTLKVGFLVVKGLSDVSS